MYFLSTTNLIINYTNQALLLALGGWLDEKNRPNPIGKQVNHKEQISGELHITLRTIFWKFTNQSFFIIQWDVPIMYSEFDYKLQKSTLIAYTRSLTWRKKYIKPDR